MTCSYSPRQRGTSVDWYRGDWGQRDSDAVSVTLSDGRVIRTNRRRA